MGIKSVITHPSGTMQMSGPGLYDTFGIRVWSGSGRVIRVEISADGVKSWADAMLHNPVHPKAMTRFSLPWRWDGAPALLMSRAHDEAGYVEPTPRHMEDARHALSNYNHYNAIQTWRVYRKRRRRELCNA